MPLEQCPTCGRDVSSNAPSCPHCGEPCTQEGFERARAARLQREVEELKQEKRNHRISSLKTSIVSIFKLIGIIILFVFLYKGCVEKDEKERQAEVAAPTCKSNYKLCKDNEDLINNYNGILDATFACKRVVDDNVKYGSPDWNFISKFGQYRAGKDYVEKGIIYIADREVKIQNEYGVSQKSEVFCEYDLISKKVLNISINGVYKKINDSKPIINQEPVKKSQPVSNSSEINAPAPIGGFLKKSDYKILKLTKNKPNECYKNMRVFT